MHEGWIRLWRSINDNVFLQHDDNAYIVFTKLLTRVNSHGQYAGGRRQLAELMHMNDRTLYDTLRRLQANQMITINANHRYTIYSICKWSHYQSKPNQRNEMFPTTDQPLANHKPTTGQHSSKNKNKNKEGGASKIDSDLAAKEKAARGRPLGPGHAKAASIAQTIKLKALERK